MTIESLSYKITDSDLTVSVTYVDETGEHIQNIEAVVVDNVVDFSATDRKIQEFFYGTPEENPSPPPPPSEE